MATTWQICAAKALAADEVWLNVADLGISGLTREENAGVDRVTFVVSGQTALTDAALFAPKTVLRFRRVDNSVPTLWFLGRVNTPRRRATGKQERRAYTVNGPWDWFEHTVYRQSWTEQAGVIRKPRVVLFQGANGARCTSGAQILDAVLWAKTCGAPIATPLAGNIITGVALPFDERVNIMVADVVCTALSWHSHTIPWWDYTQRDPVFHCDDRTTLGTVNLPVSAVASDIDIIERSDMQVPAMAICYEKTVQVDDASWTNTYFDIAPVIAGETQAQTDARLDKTDVVWATFELDGYVRQNVQQEIKTEAFPSNYLDIAWWKAREPWLKDYADADITLANGARKNDSALPRILVEGTMQKWMNKDAEPERICVDATITVKEGSQIVTVEKRPITLSVTATDATTKTYKQMQSLDTGESVPQGVASALYTEWSGLHFEGSVVVTAAECAGTHVPGRALNITGGDAAWTNMRAMICRTVEDIDYGTTTIDFGPIKIIDAQSLVALFRATRNRRFSCQRQFRTGAADQPDSEATGSGDITSNPGYSGLSTTKRKVILDIAAQVKHLIDLDSGAFAFATGSDGSTARVIKPREVLMPYKDANGNPVAKLSQCLCSPGYGTEVSLGGLPATPTSWVTFGPGANSLSAAGAPNWQPNNNGIGLRVYHHRTAYKSSATEELQGYYWLESFAADGRLLSVSGETKYTINYPEEQ